jgi:hypothetical protein
LVLGVSRSRLAASFCSAPASSGFLWLPLCLWCESFLLRMRKARQPEPHPDLRLVARSASLVPAPLSCELIWLSPVTALHRFSLLLVRFPGRTDRVSSCTISSSARLLGFSVEILLPPRAGHPVRQFLVRRFFLGLFFSIDFPSVVW